MNMGNIMNYAAKNLKFQIISEFGKLFNCILYCKILHLWTFASHHKISVLFNDFSLVNKKSICTAIHSTLIKTVQSLYRSYVHSGSLYTCHISLPENEMHSDIWRMSRLVHKWHHSNSILALQCICCNLQFCHY